MVSNADLPFFVRAESMTANQPPLILSYWANFELALTEAIGVARGTFLGQRFRCVHVIDRQASILATLGMLWDIPKELQ